MSGHYDMEHCSLKKVLPQPVSLPQSEYVDVELGRNLMAFGYLTLSGLTGSFPWQANDASAMRSG
jgi:hypothetical protein